MEAFEKECMKHADSLYNFAYKLTMDKDDAQDLVQETYLRAYKYFNYFQQGTNAKSWMFKILKNIFINDYRKAQRKPSEFTIDDVNEGKFERHLYRNNNDFFNSAISDEYVLALDTLPVELKSIFIMKYIEDFKYEEIAKIYDIPLGTVKSWLNKARTRLKDVLVQQKAA